MMVHKREWLLLTFSTALVLFLTLSMQADEEPVSSTEKAQAAENSDAQPALSAKQDALKGRFARFEKTLLQLIEYTRGDEDRFRLLNQVLSKSKTSGIPLQMQKIVALLGRRDDGGQIDPQFGDAIELQSQLLKQLQSLVNLLQSEDRLNELEKEKARILALMKEVNHLIGKEKDLRVATERGGEPGKLAERQEDIAKQTEKVVDNIDAQDAEKKKENDTDSEQSSADKKPKKGEGESGDKKPKPGETPQSESKDKKPNKKPSENPSQSGKPNKGQQSEEQKSAEQQPKQSQNEDKKATPGRKEIEEAHREMERAIEELKKRNADKASDHQDEAIQKLVDAKEKLEEILRQLREEEQQLLLQSLEARFQKMLTAQLNVYHETVRIDNVPEKDRTNRHRTRAHELARDEEEIVRDAEKALALLKEEGSSVAFPEAVTDLRNDMLSIVRWLDAEPPKVGDFTQEIEQEIIEALEEMIEALQKEMEKNDDQKQQQQNQQGQQQPNALVDTISEIKMLRSLQLRINRRTKRLGRRIDGDQADNPEVLSQLRELARRQARVQQATYNLVSGRNR